MTPDQIAELKRIAEAVEPALSPLVRKAADDFYERLMTSVQDYLADNVAFNLTSHIEMLERSRDNLRVENTALAARIEALEGERDDMQSRYILRMADIREASGVGHKPMLDEVAEAIRGRIEALEAGLKSAAARFRHYEQLHAAKGSPDGGAKAQNNADMAQMIEALLGDRHD